MIYVIITVVVLAIIFNFIGDKNKVIEQNIKNGGLKAKFPNFVRYCEAPLSASSNRKMELVKDTGSKLEYKLPIKKEDEIKGYFYLGIESSFNTIVYCYAVSNNGTKHKGLMHELKNPMRIPNYEPMEFEYSDIFNKILAQMVSSKEFQKLGFE